MIPYILLTVAVLDIIYLMHTRKNVERECTRLRSQLRKVKESIY